ncbi:MAG: PAS domain S-box protein [Acidobacteria bacterium]|nr:PAS domain S-box protein [Acidobacteriota bacterium]
MTGAGHILGSLSEQTGDDARLRELLLEFSAAASRAPSSRELLELFCRSGRAYFGSSAAYIWQFLAPDELEGWEADGWMADEFRGTRLKTTEAVIVSESIQTRRACYVNALDVFRYPMAAKFDAKSLLVAPLVVFGDVVGATVWTHSTDPHFFRQEHVEPAAILAGQLGTLLEAATLAEQTKEEERRSEVLLEAAHSMRGAADSSLLIELVAEKLRLLLLSPLVCVFTRTAGGFELAAAATRDPAVSASIRARWEGKGVHFAADISRRAILAGELITVSVNPASHLVADVVPAGTLLAAPFSTSNKEGAVLVYPRREGAFTREETKLLPVVTSFAALAIANAELYRTASSEADELHDILATAGELGSVSGLDQFMRRFLERAGRFLGFGRAFAGLLENDRFELRWSHPHGADRPPGYVIPDAILRRATLRKEIFSSDDLAKGEAEIPAEYQLKQLLAVPLVAAGGDPLGVFGVCNRHEHRPISQEDIRRAQALAGHMAAVLEVSRNLVLSERYRKRSELLTELALEMSSLVRGADFAPKFLERAARITGASDAALVTEAPGNRGIRVLHSLTADAHREAGFASNVISTLRDAREAVLTRTAGELFGGPPPADTEWSEVAVVRLTSAGGDLLGGLCLANCRVGLSGDDRRLLEAISGAASVSIEGARYFTRMKQANRHWVEIFNAIPDFIVAHDRAGNVVRVNRALADLTGVQPQQMIGLNIASLLAAHPTEPPAGCPFCRLRGELSEEYLDPALERTFLVSTSEVNAGGSDGLETVHVLKDITHRREAERRDRELFDDIEEGLFFSSPDGRFIEINHALARMLGRERPEEMLESSSLKDVFLRSEEHAALSAEIERLGSLKNRPATLRRKDGSPLQVLINAFAVHGREGQVTQYRGLIQDVTSRKAYQAELERERDFSSKILNNTQSLILVADKSGLVSYANRRWQVMGCEQQAIIGKPLEFLVAPSSHEAFHRAYSAVLAGNHVDNLALEVLRADCRIGQFSVNLSPMRDERGEVASIVVVMSDVGDAAFLQSQLIHSEKMAAVGQLVSTVAHEVNNPLTAILGFSDMLVENPELPEGARKNLRVILDEAQRTKQIVQNLLSFARQMPPERKPIQLNPILKRTLELRTYDLRSRGVSVVENLGDPLPPVIGDAYQMQQVFLNILNNAYDAVRENVEAPRIEISTACIEGVVEVTFRDNGCGISHPDRVFDPFFSTKQVGEGTGLGLSICYGIVKEHGGEIGCENNAAGPGATFTLRLPAAGEAARDSGAAGVEEK